MFQAAHCPELLAENDRPVTRDFNDVTLQEWKRTKCPQSGVYLKLIWLSVADSAWACFDFSRYDKGCTVDRDLAKATELTDVNVPSPCSGNDCPFQHLLAESPDRCDDNVPSLFFFAVDDVWYAHLPETITPKTGSWWRRSFA